MVNDKIILSASSSTYESMTKAAKQVLILSIAILKLPQKLVNQLFPSQ